MNERTLAINEGYARLQNDLARLAAIVAIAEALGLSRIATSDRRHFRPLAAAFSLELLP